MTAQFEYVDGFLIPEMDLVKMCRQWYKNGISDCLASMGKLPDYYSMHGASKIYGRKTVEHWVESRIVKLDRTGRNYRIRRVDLETAALGNKKHIMKGKVLVPKAKANEKVNEE